jgi:hypothetical protein
MATGGGLPVYIAAHEKLDGGGLAEKTKEANSE